MDDLEQRQAVRTLDPEAIARVIKGSGGGSELLFNYKTSFNECWRSKVLQRKYDYSAVYPATEGARIQL